MGKTFGTKPHSECQRCKANLHNICGLFEETEGADDFGHVHWCGPACKAASLASRGGGGGGAAAAAAAAPLQPQLLQQHPPARLASRGALAPPARTLPPVLRQLPVEHGRLYHNKRPPVDLLPLLCRLCHKRLPVDLPTLCCLYHKRLPVHLLYGLCRLCGLYCYSHRRPPVRALPPLRLQPPAAALGPPVRVMAVPVAPAAAKQQKEASGRKWLDNGDKAGSVIVVADKWGVSVKTVRRIIKDKSRILSAPAGAKRVRMRGDGKPTFEKRMIEWMELVRKTKTTTLTVTMNSTPHIIIMVTTLAPAPSTARSGAWISVAICASM